MKEEIYIRRCFELAKLGAGNVSPNPMVGCVIVCNDMIIGEGYHKIYGEAHAEVNAINSVKDKELLKESTLYVSLEPCCHYGKTPPCANLIVDSNIPKVVISNRDPNPKVDGGGIKILEDAGIEVVIGVLEKEGRELNKRFFTSHEKHRPYIILKWAQTIDGFMDIDRKRDIKDYWITNDNLKVWVHKQRVEEDAILVGKNTVINDNPRLNVRHVEGRNPIRLIIDRGLNIPKDIYIYDNTQRTIIFNSLVGEEKENTVFVRLDFEKDIIDQIIQYIYSIKIKSIIVEGGRRTLDWFIEKGAWDEANVLVGNNRFYHGLKSPTIADELLDRVENFGDNKIKFYRKYSY